MTTARRRLWLQGALTPLAVCVGLVACTVMFWPDETLFGPLGRVLENLAPHLIVAGIGLAAMLACLGSRWLGIGLICCCLLGGGLVLHRHLLHAQPLLPEARTDVTVLWFNLLKTNTTAPEVLIAALADSPADVVILAEASPLQSHLDALAADFPYQIGCRKAHCELLVLSRIPLLSSRLRQDIRGPRAERLVTLTVALKDRPALTIVGMQMIKPWYYGFAEHDTWFAMDEIRQATGPVVMAGDFNAAPWSGRLQTLFRICGLATVRWPVATWPAAAGNLGIPIDLFLTRGGARIRSERTWGADLGSNHRGLLAEITLQNQAPPPDQACDIPN